MNGREGRSGVLTAPIVLAGLLISVSAVLFAGCALFSREARETRQLYREVGGSKGSLTKTLAILPLENRVPWSRIELETHFSNELKSEIEDECDHIRVLLPGSPEFPARLKQLQRQENGEPDNYTLALSGRASGINLVMSVALVSISHITEDRGIFWWKKTHHLARIQMDVSVFHTGTGAKLLDQTIFQTVEINESEGLRIAAQEIPDTATVTDTLPDIAETIGEMADLVFKYIPWEGHIRSVDGNRLVLSAGKAIGLKKGRVLDVFSADNVTRGKEGRRFFTVGGKIGRITLTEVYPDHSEAVLKEGGPVPPGSVVRLP